MPDEWILSDSARIAELEKRIRGLERENQSLQAQLEGLHAGTVPPPIFTGEERAVLGWCAKVERPVRLLDLLDHLGGSELRAHVVAENLLRRGVFEKRVVTEDGEPTYVLTAFGAKIAEAWSKGHPPG